MLPAHHRTAAREEPLHHGVPVDGIHHDEAVELLGDRRPAPERRGHERDEQVGLRRPLDGAEGDIHVVAEAQGVIGHVQPHRARAGGAEVSRSDVHDVAEVARGVLDALPGLGRESALAAKGERGGGP